MPVMVFHMGDVKDLIKSYMSVELTREVHDNDIQLIAEKSEVTGEMLFRSDVYLKDD